MTTDTLEALREAREALGRIIDVADRTSWAVNTSLMDASITEARAALSRIDAALAEGEGDYRMVPVEPTEQQLAAWGYAVRQHAHAPWDIWTDGRPDAQAWAEIVPLYASPDHIGNSTTMVPTLGVEGVRKTVEAAVKSAIARRMQAETCPVRSFSIEYRWAERDAAVKEATDAIIAARGKNDGATLGVARIKSIIWKHWRNQNGQTLEDRFTSAAEEIAAMEKQDG